MAVYPQQLRPREELNLRLGIKSSLSQLRSVVASLYIIYIANNKQPNVVYSKQQTQNGREVIKLSEELLQSINAKYTNASFANLVESSPLFTSQLESLQVGIELFFHLGKVDFTASNLSERTGTNRYQKKIAFATNMMLVDLLLSSYSDVEVNSLLLSWLDNREVNSNVEDKLCLMLNTFTEETQYKIRDTKESEIIFNQEGVYSAIFASNEVSSNDTKEPVGPFRVYKSFLSSGMHPFIIENRQTIHLKGNTNQDELKRYSEMVNTTLSLIPRRSIVTQEITVDNHIDDSETTQPPQNTDSIPEHFRPFLTAIRSKPFLLLAGISGTGKSRIVRELARACWDSDNEEYKAQKPKNFEMIQVKPNWHDSTELIGYVSRASGAPEFVAGDFLKFVVKAWEDTKTPYFLCLDEMNLAPVEQYFAEYLSVIESRKFNGKEVVTDPILKKEAQEWYHNLVCTLTEDSDLQQQFLQSGISIPKNLIVIGTVNMDETTFAFSRKVLDRAMTIEMNEVDLHGGLTEKTENIGKINFDTVVGDAVEGVDVYTNNQKVCDTVIEYLQSINDKLNGTPFKIAYRTRNEFLLYVVNNLPYSKDEKGNDLNQNYVIARALDEITSMKILSRIEGDEDKTRTVIEDLKKAIDSGLKDVCDSFDTTKSVSLLKLNEMENRLSSGYTSFWS